MNQLDVALSVVSCGLAFIAAAALHSRRKALWLRREREADCRRLEKSLAEHGAEAKHLAEVRLPALTESLWRTPVGASVSPLLHPHLATGDFGIALDAVLRHVSALTVQASERAEDTTQAAVRGVMRSVQSLSTDVQTAVTEMLHRHHDEKVLADGNQILHMANQLGRRARIALVMSGDWPGRARTDSPLLDVVRGAQSLISEYNRMRIVGEPVPHVTGPAVEYVVLALAEIMDNAARYSSPSSDVYVRFISGHHGVTVVVDDAGINMTPEVRDRAARLLSGQVPVRLTELRNPLELGFAGIGRLCARQGFRVSVASDSPYGGVSATLFLPTKLLTLPAPSQVAQPRSTAAADPALSVPGSAPFDHSLSDQPVSVAPETYRVEPDGLPRRRRGPRGAHRAGAPVAPPVNQPPTDGGINAAAFARGVDTARMPTHRDEEKTL